MGGQGSPWYRELKKIYDTQEYKEFFFHCFDSLNELKSLTSNAIATPKGIHPELWLKDESTLPEEDYLSTAGISLIMIQVTQLAYFEQLRTRYPLEKILEIVAGATGHSQGLISITLVALGLDGNDYYEALRFYMKYITYLALRSQEVFPYLEPSEEDLKLAHELKLSDPSPMVAVLGSDHSTIKHLVDAFNQKYPDEPRIYVSLYNSPTNRILSSHRKSLLLFYKENQTFFAEHKIRYIFLKTTCPFHSPYMEEAYIKSLEDVRKLNFSYDTKDFKIPIYTFATGEDYRNHSDLLKIMGKDLLINTLHWDKAILPAVNHQVGYIIDFGPGKTSQRLTTENLEHFQSNIPVLTMSNPKEVKEIL